MVVVGGHDSGLRASGANGEPVGVLLRVDAQPAQLGHDRGDAIGLLAADEANSAHLRGTVSEDRNRGEGLSGVGDVGHLDLDAAQGAPSADHDVIVGPLDSCTHPGQDVDEGDVALGGPPTEAVDAHRAACDHRGRRPVRRSRRVGLHLEAGYRPIPTGRHAQRSPVVVDLHRRAERLHHLDGEPDVGHRHELGADLHRQAVVEARPRQEQPREELAADVARHRNGPPEDVAARRGDPHRQVSGLAEGVHADAKVAECIEQRSHRTTPHRLGAVDHDRATGQRGDRSDEARRGPRQSNVEDRSVDRRPTGTTVHPQHGGRGTDRPFPAAGHRRSDTHPERSKAVEHRRGVVSLECPDHVGDPTGERRAHQGTVRHALGAGRSDRRVERAGHRLDRQRVPSLVDRRDHLRHVGSSTLLMPARGWTPPARVLAIRRPTPLHAQTTRRATACRAARRQRGRPRCRRRSRPSRWPRS